MKLTVKTLQGVAFSIDAESTDTVRRHLPVSLCLSPAALCR